MLIIPPANANNYSKPLKGTTISFFHPYFDQDYLFLGYQNRLEAFVLAHRLCLGRIHHLWLKAMIFRKRARRMVLIARMNILHVAYYIYICKC